MRFLPRRWFSGVLLALLVPSSVFAATRTWDGGGADNNWSTAANWSSDTAPTATDIALFDGTGKKSATIDAAFGGSVAELRFGSSNTGTITAVRSLTVNGNVSLSGGTLTVNGGNTVTVKGSWQNGGGTFTANTGSVVLSGSGTSYVVRETGAFQHLSLNDGLIGYWRLDETSGIIAVDSSSVGANLDHSGPTISTDVPTLGFTNGRSLSFDGINDYAAYNGASLHPANYVSVSTWLKPTAATYGMPIAHNGFITYGIIYDGSAFRSALRTTSAFYNPTISQSFLINSWYHVAETYDGQKLRLYVNGVLIDSTTAVGTLSYGGTEFMLGTYTYNACCNYAGLIDDVRIYSRALSSSEIQALASGEQGTGSGTYTLGSNLTVDGNLNIYSGNLDVSSSNYAVTASGSFINNARFTPRSGTVTLAGIGTTLKMYGTSLYNITIDSAKSAILRTAATVTNTLTVASSAALNLNGFDLTATLASISNLGTITEATGAILHTSSLSASPSSLAIGSSISISLTDSDANLDGTARETVTVTANGETVTLTETTTTSGIFTGSIATAHGAGRAGNGIIENTDACSFFVNVTYWDPQDGADSVTVRATVTDSGVSCEIGGGGGGRSIGTFIRESIGVSLDQRTTSPSNTSSSNPSSTITNPKIIQRIEALSRRRDIAEQKLSSASSLERLRLQATIHLIEFVIGRLRVRG